MLFRWGWKLHYLRLQQKIDKVRENIQKPTFGHNVHVFTEVKHVSAHANPESPKPRKPQPPNFIYPTRKVLLEGPELKHKPNNPTSLNIHPSEVCRAHRPGIPHQAPRFCECFSRGVTTPGNTRLCPIGPTYTLSLLHPCLLG